MKKIVLVLAAVCASCAPQAAADKDVAAWEKQARGITIIRDTWGIPHIYGKTDADAVFGVGDEEDVRHERQQLRRRCRVRRPGACESRVRRR
jgi:Penicillin amidase